MIKLIDYFLDMLFLYLFIHTLTISYPLFKITILYTYLIRLGHNYLNLFICKRFLFYL